MWFDNNYTHTCVDCKYGDKDYEHKVCKKCFITSAFCEKHYTRWEPLKEEVYPILKKMKDVFSKSLG